MTVPLFPGAIGVSHLRVYDSVAPDGLRGGSPHVHTACTEAYAVIAGRGSVQTLSSDGYVETPLVAGTFAWFTPGTVHRLVNEDGRLELFVLMANSGLPEAGDMVLAFPDDVLGDPLAYWQRATLPPGATTTDGDAAFAMARRDLAVAGFAELRNLVEAKGPSALDGFYRRVASLLGERVAEWRPLVEGGAAAEVEQTWRRMRALAAGETGELESASVHRGVPPEDVRRFGCCGTLGSYV